jgi:hypothetical protein
MARILGCYAMTDEVEKRAKEMMRELRKLRRKAPKARKPKCRRPARPRGEKLYSAHSGWGSSQCPRVPLGTVHPSEE